MVKWDLKNKQENNKTIPSDWEIVSFADIVEVSGGTTPDTTNTGYWNGDIPWLTPKDITKNHTMHVAKTGRKITQSGLEHGPRNLHPVGSILMTSRAPVGIPVINDIPMAVNQGFIAINCKTTDNHFLYYWIRNNLEYLKSASNGTTFLELSKSTFKILKISLPKNIEEQKSISKILYDLDILIENIQKQNKTLDFFLKAVFKSWFVDFDDQTEFIDSELGDIPKGWEIKTIQDLCSLIQSGGTPGRKESTFWENGTIDWYKTGELHDNFLLKSEERITELGLKKSSSNLWPENTILFAIYAFPVVGRLGILTRPSCSNQACAGLIAKDSIGTNFLFFSFIFSRSVLSRIATGAAQQNINLTILKNHKIIVPPNSLISKFNKLSISFLEMIKINDVKITDLKKSRDTLLPKLISGEIRIHKKLENRA
jgi:type I restriction enzyme, S subunit